MEMPTGAVTVIMPVGVLQEGWVVIEAAGIAGATGIALMSNGNAAETHPDTLSIAVTEYEVPGVRPAKTPLAWYALPILY